MTQTIQHSSIKDKYIYFIELETTSHVLNLIYDIESKSYFISKINV